MFGRHLSPPAALSVPALPGIRRESFEDINEPPPKRQAMMSPIEPSPYTAPRDYRYHSIQPTPPPPQPQRLQHQHHQQPHREWAQPQYSPKSQQPSPVNIKPRPVPAPNGSAPSTINPTVATNTPTADKPKAASRKRGRPSKAEKEAQAKANAFLANPTGYLAITPAPIAPNPSGPVAGLPPLLTASQLQTHYSPSPVATTPSYQLSAATPEPKPTPKRKSRPPPLDKSPPQERLASEPRTIQSLASALQEQSVATELRGADYQEHLTRQQEQAEKQPPGPVPLEPRIEPLATPLHQQARRRRSHSPFAPGSASTDAHGGRESMGPAMEQQARGTESDYHNHPPHPPVANQA